MLQTIKHNSLPVRSVILVCMHIFVDVFLIGFWLCAGSADSGKTGHDRRRIDSEAGAARAGRRVAVSVSGCGLCLELVACGFGCFGYTVDYAFPAVPRIPGRHVYIFFWSLHDGHGFSYEDVCDLFQIVGRHLAPQPHLWARLTVCRGWGPLPEDLGAILEEGDSPPAMRGAARLATWPTSRKMPLAAQRLTKALSPFGSQRSPRSRPGPPHGIGRSGAPCPPWPGRFGAKMARRPSRPPRPGTIGPSAPPVVEDPFCCGRWNRTMSPSASPPKPPPFALLPAKRPGASP